MKLKNSYFYSLREAPKDEESISGILLNRAGYIKKTSAGIYMFLPLGLKVKNNIEKIIREEMEKTGCQELIMPCMIPEDVYIASGRRKNFGNSMFSLEDRAGKKMVLGPTHEELFAVAASMKVNSYKDLPFSLYQMQTKFRDEVRPRYGLIRVKEFVMKDAYTFDLNLEGLDNSYNKIFNAYKNVFDRLNLDYKIVVADTGVMGGLLSEEFQAISDIGEDTVVLCDSCDYASNLEVSKKIDPANEIEAEKPLQMVETPDQESIEAVAKYLNLPIEKTVKAMLMNVDGKFVVCLIRGNRELNEAKILKLLKGQELNFANDELIATSNAIAGYTGPIGLKATVVIDSEVLTMKNFVTGANKKGYHYINTNVKDFTYDLVGDIVNIQQGDKCPNCGGNIFFKKGIEVGNTFKLGTSYSESMNLYYQDKDMSLKPVVMGSYGIGVGRTMAAIVEQNHDENGLIWPINIAPYKVGITIINVKDETQVSLANQIYDRLMDLGIEPIMDDRDERAGVKFKDMELIGIPMRITVGREAVNDNVEFILRTEKEKEILSTKKAIQKVIDLCK
ncbi:MAG TPA: proline--tRNA ligase [Erysipelotrichaceae bacterium]|jgi:prolyl-tRNA synthetase|nr:proline--tRNA ligase [Erysipelotrichaceae bacterium]